MARSTDAPTRSRVRWVDRVARTPARIVLLYLLSGALWIFLSDRAVSFLIQNPARVEAIQTVKGWLFVAATAAMLWLLIRRGTAALQASKRELQESQRRLVTLMGNLPGMVYRCRNDADWTMEFVSEGCFGLTGYTPEDRISNRVPPRQVIHPDDLDRVKTEVDAALGARRPFRLIYRIITAKGEEKWVWEQGEGIEASDGAVEAIEGFTTDITEWRRAEISLRESEERYHSLFQESRDAIYITTREGRLIDANPAMLDLFGFSLDEMLSLNVAELYAQPDDRARFQAEIESTGFVTEYPVTLLRGDGVEMECLISATTWRSTGGAVVGYRGSIRDITEQKAAERALRESEERLRRVVTAIPVVLFAVDAEGVFTLSEGQALAAIGRRPGEVVGRSAFEVYRDEPRIVENIRRALGGEEFTDVVPVGDVVFETRYTPLRDNAGEVVGAIGVAANITDRVSAEENQRRLAEILEATPDIVGIATPEGRVVYRNAAARRMLGPVDGAGSRPQAIWDSHPEPWRSQLREGAIPAAVRHGVWQGETVLRDAEESEIPVSQVIVAHRTEEGEVALLSTIARDISEQKSLEAQLRQAQKLEAIGRLAGGIAHDFNNLLTAILGNCELILHDAGPDDPSRPGLHEIRKAAASAASLTRQLLAFSRRQVLRPRVLDLNRVVTGMEGMLRRLIGEDVELSIRLDPDLSSVRADPSQVEQVVMNLVVNARDAMPTGGALTIETADVELDDRYVLKRPQVQPGPYVRLAISDTGTGIDEETRSRIFEPFFTTKEKGKGTGLGLSTVYGIVKQSGGYIWVYSEPGQGTTFKIYLPRVVESAEVPEHAEGTQPAEGSETVLLVEDEGSLRSPLRRGLERLGYRVLEAADGESALRTYESSGHEVDIVVTDVVMPGMNGRQLAERLSRLRPGLRILFMSGYADEAIVQNGILGDGLAFMEKPFTPEALARKIRSLLVV